MSLVIVLLTAVLKSIGVIDEAEISLNVLMNCRHRRGSWTVKDFGSVVV